MRVERTSIFEAPAARVGELMSDPAVMCFLLRPLVTVEPIDPPALPTRWAPGRYRIGMRLAGFIPLGWQDVVVTDLAADPAAGRWRMHDAGRGLLARRWDHVLTVQALDDGRTRYTDRIEVKAGIATVPTWLFAQLVFAWRHHRWRVLLRKHETP